MSEWLASVWAAKVQLALGLLGVVVTTLVTIAFAGDQTQFPVAVLLLPVMGMALVSETPATVVVAACSVAVGAAEYAVASFSEAEMGVRFAALVIGAVLACALTVVRSRREAALAAKSAELARAETRLESEALVTAILERSPELNSAADIPALVSVACRMARELFGSSAASYWQVEGDDCVLVARDPGEGTSVGTRMPAQLFATPFRSHARSLTAWQRLDDVAPDEPQRRSAMLATGAVVGAATPLLVGGVVVAYFAQSWDHDQPAPDVWWSDAVDRFVAQVALAKTVIRRRTAQAEARQLAERLQAGLLPQSLPDPQNVEVRTVYRAGLEQMILGGDFLDVRENGGSLLFLLGDVSGHGPEQAALGALLRAAWIGVTSTPGSVMKEWAPALERILETNRADPDAFVTLVMGAVEPAAGTLRYVCAGHPPPLLLTPAVEPLPGGGPPLGMGLNTDLDEIVVELREPWSVLMVTDGLFEGRSGDRRPGRLGFEAFCDGLRAGRAVPDLDDPLVLSALVDEMERRNGGALGDDAAAILLSSRTS